MPILKNKLKQRIQIDLLEGRAVGLLAEGTAEINEKDLASPHLKGFIKRRDVVVISPEKKKESSATSGKKG